MIFAQRLQSIGMHVSRYGLMLILMWIGGMKFTAIEAEGIKPLTHSPLLSWASNCMSTATFAQCLGIVEIILAVLIALRPVAPGLSALGSLFASVMFLVTLSFLFTTPGWEPTLGFPALSVVPGQFVLKDIALLGISLWTAGEALFAAKLHCPSTRMAEAAR